MEILGPTQARLSRSMNSGRIPEPRYCLILYLEASSLLGHRSLQVIPTVLLKKEVSVPANPEVKATHKLPKPTTLVTSQLFAKVGA